MFKELGVGTLEVSRNAAAKGGIVKCENRYRLVLGLRTAPVIGPPLHSPLPWLHPTFRLHVGVRPCQDRSSACAAPSGSAATSQNSASIKSIQFCRIGTSKAIQCGKGKPTASSCLSCQRTQVYYVSFIHNSLQIYLKSFQRLSG